MKRMQPHFQRAQHGVTLIITLIMLALVMLVGVASMGTATVDESMAGHSRDRDKALQAAEAAVRLCLLNVKNASIPVGLTLTPAASGATPLWEIAANWSSSSTTVESVALLPSPGTAAGAGLSEWPKCMYEKLGAGSDNYRITGRATGGFALTEVILQATYSVE
jgi:type IV pilus assembly protein PilX